MNKVCLNMIVKNEAHVIRRCLASVRPFIDSWVIVDTGSSDGTQQVIRDFMRDLPGELHERPWKDFGHNRSEAIELAKGQGDYLFMIDADEVLQLPPGYTRPPLANDAYMLDVRYGGINYHRMCLVRSALPWRYVGVLHEYLEASQPVASPLLPGPTVIVHTDGARSQLSISEKYARDAEVLKAALREEPGNKRYLFYLAQSYRDSEQMEKALGAYERRATLGGWDEEVWYSLWSTARIAERLGHSPDEVTHRYLRAYNHRPGRAEALSELARYQRGLKQFAAARLFAERAMRTPMTTDILFVDRSHYQWRATDEYAVASYWTGDYSDSARACRQLLANPLLPASERPRMLENLAFAEKALDLMPATDGAAPVLPPLGVDPPVVMIAILARNKAHVLADFLRCVEALDYPKARLYLYVRTNDNRDDTELILRNWLAGRGHHYLGVDFHHLPPLDAEAADIGADHQPHQWSAPRLRLLARIREASLRRAQQLGVDYYLVIDCDNFVRPWTLRSLIGAGKPIVAPMLRAVPGNSRYSNYFCALDPNGYYAEHPDYDPILGRERRGCFEVPLVHCTYLIAAEALPELAYHDEGPEAMEFVTFARVARSRGIAQFIDNRYDYGVLLNHGGAAEGISLEQEAALWKRLAGAVMARVLP